MLTRGCQKEYFVQTHMHAYMWVFNLKKEHFFKKYEYILKKRETKE